jgi:Pyruvate/2-oxoacid:ferredoxin oxidoreductase delta subunit
MTEDVFHKLQAQLNRYMIGFPLTESGIEIKILKNMFTEEEAAMFTTLTAELETPPSISERLDAPVEDVAARLEDMALKGLIYRVRHDDQVKYSAVPFMHGLVEFQIKRISKDSLKMLGQYFREKYKTVMCESEGLFIRTIPVHQSLDNTHPVAAYDDACQILRDQELIVITDCACKRNKARFDRDCGRPIEVCFMFGPMGQYYIDNGLGHEIDLEEALQIQAKANEAGLVTQPATAQNPFTMCNCCSDCCGVLSSIHSHPRPAELVLSNYQASVDRGKCTGCETCIGRCQMSAAKMKEAHFSTIDLDRCIGCGLCVTTCPEKAIQLLSKPENKRYQPPVRTTDQMRSLARKRGRNENDVEEIVSFGFK